MNPPPTSLPTTSLWVIPMHQRQASCTLRQTWTGLHLRYNATRWQWCADPEGPSRADSLRIISKVLFILKAAASASNAGDLGSIPGSGRSPGEGNGNPLQYSCLENPMDGEA